MKNDTRPGRWLRADRRHPARRHATLVLSLCLACSGNDDARHANHGGAGPAGGAPDDVRTVSRALTAPTITVPTALATEPVGRMLSGGSVTLDGAYTYNVPIAVPPGRAGMEPSVALAY